MTRNKPGDFEEEYPLTDEQLSWVFIQLRKQTTVAECHRRLTGLDASARDGLSVYTGNWETFRKRVARLQKGVITTNSAADAKARQQASEDEQAEREAIAGIDTDKPGWIVKYWNLLFKSGSVSADLRSKAAKELDALQRELDPTGNDAKTNLMNPNIVKIDFNAIEDANEYWLIASRQFPGGLSAAIPFDSLTVDENRAIEKTVTKTVKLQEKTIAANRVKGGMRTEDGRPRIPIDGDPRSNSTDDGTEGTSDV